MLKTTFKKPRLYSTIFSAFRRSAIRETVCGGLLSCRDETKRQNGKVGVEENCALRVLQSPAVIQRTNQPPPRLHLSLQRNFTLDAASFYSLYKHRYFFRASLSTSPALLIFSYSEGLSHSPGKLRK